MKWFKHISDSLDDPFIFELVTTFGGDGYLVFFGVLEIYSREFKTELGWKLKITRAYLRQKLQKRQDTLIINCLKHIKNSGKWQVDFIEQQVIIFIPKFTEIIDEWTSRKLVSKSGVALEILKHDKEEEEDKELDKEKDVGKVDIQKKESKERKTFIPPSVNDVKAFFQEKGYRQDIAQKAFDYYSTSGWVDSKGNKVRNWKQKMIAVWMRDEHRELSRPAHNGKTLEELIS